MLRYVIHTKDHVGVTTKMFRATHTKHDGLLESNSHNILQTHGSFEVAGSEWGSRQEKMTVLKRRIQSWIPPDCMEHIHHLVCGTVISSIIALPGIHDCIPFFSTVIFSCLDPHSDPATSKERLGIIDFACFFIMHST